MEMDAPPVAPQPEEWEAVIIPALRAYLASENHALYEIDVRDLPCSLSLSLSLLSLPVWLLHKRSCFVFVFHTEHNCPGMDLPGAHPPQERRWRRHSAGYDAVGEALLSLSLSLPLCST